MPALSGMPRSKRIEAQVNESLRPVHLELANESSQHSVPADSETHFKLLVVSDQFSGLSRVERQRKIYSLLDSEFKSGLHALTVKAMTPEEWQKNGAGDFISPECLGGSKHDGKFKN
jgi:stress-induced morphogen